MTRLAKLFAACVLLTAPAACRADDAAELKAVIAKVLKAAAADKLKATKAWKLTETVKSSQETTTVITTYAQLPDRFRVETVITRKDQKTSFVTVISGDKGWGKNASEQATEMLAATVAARKRQLPFDSFRQVVLLDEPGLQVALLPGRTVGDRAADAVKLGMKGEDARVLLFDKQTGLLLRREITTGIGDAESTLAVDYADIREVSGIPVAHKRVTTRNGKPGFEVRTDALTFPDKLDDKLFEKPE